MPWWALLIALVNTLPGWAVPFVMVGVPTLLLLGVLKLLEIFRLA